MSNVPLPEPHHQSAANFNAPDEPFYTADQMHAHAAAVSAAKDAEIAGLRAELIKSLADNAALRADAIDPGLKEWFKDYRDQVTAAKQRRRDELHQGPKTERTRVPGYTGPREPAAEKRVA